MIKEKSFHPNWISSPGETIMDILEERNITADEFSKRMGQSIDDVNKLFKGQSPITMDVARQLESVLGSSFSFWIQRENQFRESFEMIGTIKASSLESEWLRGLPISSMVSLGWLSEETENRVSQCLKFFGVPTIDAWKIKYDNVLKLAAYKTSAAFKSKLGSVASWLRAAEIQGENIECKEWNSDKFKTVLHSIRSLTWKKAPSDFIPELQKCCAECGVAVVIARTPEGCYSSGATKFVSPNKALMVLSFRYLSNDHFWFTFFHEAGHLILHGKNELFLEGTNTDVNQQEKEANDFAAKILIPPSFKSMLENFRPTTASVIKISRVIGIHPGIVVGQLQHLDLLKRNQLNRLKRRFIWQEKIDS